MRVKSDWLYLFIAVIIISTLSELIDDHVDSILEKFAEEDDAEGLDAAGYVGGVLKTSPVIKLLHSTEEIVEFVKVIRMICVKCYVIHIYFVSNFT